MKIDLSVSYQKKLLCILLRDKTLFLRYVDYLPLTTFDEGSLRYLWEQMRKLYKQYNTVPTFASMEMRIRQLRSDGNVRDARASLLFRTLSRIRAMRVLADRGYVLGLVDRYRSYRILRNSMKDARKKLKRGDFDGMEKLLREAFTRRTSTDEPEEALSRFHRYFAEAQMTADSAVPTLMPSLDKALLGGLKSEELGVVMGSTGMGKSMFLVSVGKAAILLGKCVVHISVEMPEARTAMRYYSALSGVATKRISKKYNVTKKKIKERRKLFNGELWIKKFPMTGTTVSDIRNYVNTLIERHTYPDILLVDYADLLVPSSGYFGKGDEYAALGHVYTELMDFSRELKIPIWTASQTTREALSKASPGLKEMGDSFKKARIAPVVLALGQTTEEEEDGVMRIILLKLRESKRRKQIPVIADFDHANMREGESDE